MACKQLTYPCISEKRTNRSLCICYLKVLEGQGSLSTLFGTPRVYVTVNFSDILMVLKNTRLKSCKRIYTIDFTLEGQFGVEKNDSGHKSSFFETLNTFSGGK